MDNKIIDLKDSFNKIISKNNELIDIFTRLGFSEIIKPIAINTVGRFLTLPREAKNRNLDLKTIIESLFLKGYEVINIPDYVGPIERITDKDIRKYLELSSIEGHPLYILAKENEEIDKLMGKISKSLDSDDHDMALITSLLNELKPIRYHYEKKCDLLYPTLSLNFKKSQMANDLYQVDDEIKMGINMLSNVKVYSFPYIEKVKDIIRKIGRMIHVEQTVLYPLFAKKYKEDDFINLSRELDKYNLAFIEKSTWDKSGNIKEKKLANITLNLPSGKMSLIELNNILNTMPYEITFVDSFDTIKYFNVKENSFYKKPISLVGTNLYSSQPPTIEQVTRDILDSFRKREKTYFEMYENISGKQALIRYIGLYQNEEYIGALEIVEDISSIKNHNE